MKKLIFTAVVALLAWTASAQQDGYLDSGNRDYRITGTENYRNTNRDYRDGVRNNDEFAGRWAVGPQIAIYTNTDTDGAVFGVGAMARYRFGEHMRVQPAVMALCEKDCSVDISGDLQYLFRVARWWEVYPMVGVGGNDFNGWSFAVDLGVGTDFAIARRWDVFASFKWMVQTKSDRKNPLVVSLGAAYKF